MAFRHRTMVRPPKSTDAVECGTVRMRVKESSQYCCACYAREKDCHDGETAKYIKGKHCKHTYLGCKSCGDVPICKSCWKSYKHDIRGGEHN